jgi:hypothetical protein
LLFRSTDIGVGHPEEPLPDVRCADARRAQIGGPDGISQRFQVSAYSSEPLPAKAACNLFPNDDWRAALRDEATELGPEVPVVGSAFSLPGDAEGLAGAGAGPGGAIVRPCSTSKSVRPQAEAGEEVALRVSTQIDRRHVADAAFVDIARHNKAGSNEVAQPPREVSVVFIVVCFHLT